ncbi:MAG: hypothetical protein ACRCYU_08190 [Nocardioides sp.]
MMCPRHAPAATSLPSAARPGAGGGAGMWLAGIAARDARVTDAGGRCECVRACDRPHRRVGDGRCHITDESRHRLVLAPSQFGLTWQAVAAAPAQLGVWCPSCLIHADRAHQRDQPWPGQLQLPIQPMKEGTP